MLPGTNLPPMVLLSITQRSPAMTSEPSTTPEVKKATLFAGARWLLALIPLLLLGAMLAYLVTTGGGMQELAGPPVEQLSIERITLPEPGMIQLEVINDGPQAVTIAQVNVDEAFWTFEVEPSNTLERLQRATVTIP